MRRSGSTDRNDRSSGFALLEVLAAVALTAAFVAVVLPFAGRMVEQWWRSESTIQDADAWMRLTARLSDDLAQAIPLPGSAGWRANLLFRASRDGIVLVRPPRAGSETASLQISAYVIERTRSGDALVNYAARFSPALMGLDPRSFGAATAVMSGPFRLAFAAIGPDGSRPDSWFDRKDMPLRIELTATPLTGGTAQTIPIVLPIAAQAPRGAAAARTTSR